MAPIIAPELRSEAEGLAARLPPLMAEAERVAATVAAGGHGRRRPGMGETFWQYRPHRPEDGFAAIDWRRSGRSDALYVRENEWEAANTVWLWRDGRAGMDWRSKTASASKRDRAAVILTALTSLLIDGGERCGVLGESAAPRAGRIGYERCAYRLIAGPGDTEGLTSPDISRFSLIVLASDFFEPLDVWRDRLGKLVGRGVRGVALQVVDPAEADFGFSGRTRFFAPGGGEDLVFGRAETARARYLKRFAAHRAAFSDLVSRAGLTFVAHRTDEPPTNALLALYAALGAEV
ncbi:MAG: DUF58 domain-containing protein [Maricaulaceae bacterium]